MQCNPEIKIVKSSGSVAHSISSGIKNRNHHFNKYFNSKTISMSEVQLTAYNVRTKEKNVPVQDAVITKTARGAYMVQGHDGKGNKLTTLVNEEKAMAAIKAGRARQGW
jgi:hypothetical protein